MSTSIIFAGTPDFAVPSLRALIDDPEFEVKLVITQPDKPVGRKQQLTPPPVKVAAIDAGIPVEQPENINNYQFPVSNFQFLVVVAYGQLLKQPILDLSEIAPINVHASLLPRWRGASPIQSALLAGDQETGVTIQRMVLELDAGPMLATESTPIEARETIETLHDRLAQIGADLLVTTLKKPLTETQQDDANMTHCTKLTRAMGNVDTKTMTAEEIDRHVRALVPWPGVRAVIEGQEVKLIETQLVETDSALAVDCKESTLFVLQLQPLGKAPMNALDWKRGRISS